MRPHRICFAGGVYHVTARCNNREFFFKDEKDFRMFLEIMLRAKQIYGVLVHAYCITSNHIHILVATPYEPNLSAFMQYLNGHFAKAYNKRHGKTGRFWGGRFHSTVIESETQFFNTLFYVEFNMARCGAVEDPAYWKWSSYRAHAFGDIDPCLDFHELYLALGNTPKERQEVYLAMAQERLREKGMLRKEPEYASGIILGSQGFIQGLLDKFGELLHFYRDRKSYPTDGGSFSLLRPPTSVPGGG